MDIQEKVPVDAGTNDIKEGLGCHKGTETFEQKQLKCNKFVSAAIDNVAPLSSEILETVLANIVKIDFVAVVNPEVKGLRSKLDKTDDPKEREHLLKQIKSLKVTMKQELVVVSEEILKTSNGMSYGFAKRDAFVFVYNSRYWCNLNKDDLQNFLGRAAEKMSVPVFEARQYSFRDMLFKQFLETAFLRSIPSNGKTTINLLNGTFDVTESGKKTLRKFNPEDFLTYQLNFAYDKNAVSPMFDKFLNEVLPDLDAQRVLAEYIAYVFTKNLKLEKALILYGTGANGKSVFFDIINALLGRENVSSYSMTDLCNDAGYHRAMIANKLVNYASEIGGKGNADTFKKLASGEPISARLPYGEPFNIENYAKLIFNANTLPRDVEQTNAFFRRFLIVPFSVTISEENQDKELGNKITEQELPGVFNWVLDGLDRLLIQKRFSSCDAIEHEVAQYKKESDTVQLFLDEEGIQPSQEKTEYLKTLYNNYRLYCQDSGFHATSNREMSKRLNNLGYFIKRFSNGYCVFAEKKCFV